MKLMTKTMMTLEPNMAGMYMKIPSLEEVLKRNLPYVDREVYGAPSCILITPLEMNFIDTDILPVRAIARVTEWMKQWTVENNYGVAVIPPEDMPALINTLQTYGTKLLDQALSVISSTLPEELMCVYEFAQHFEIKVELEFKYWADIGSPGRRSKPTVRLTQLDLSSRARYLKQSEPVPMAEPA